MELKILFYRFEKIKFEEHLNYLYEKNTTTYRTVFTVYI
jgi:hypothetical protein